MTDVFHKKNRWFIWTLVGLVAIGFITLGYIEFAKGEIDRSTVELLK